MSKYRRKRDFNYVHFKIYIDTNTFNDGLKT